LWYRLAAGSLATGEVHADRGDRVAALANFTQAVLATAQGRLAAAGQWVLNEKQIIARAGLTDVQTLIEEIDVAFTARNLREILDLPPWR